MKKKIKVFLGSYVNVTQAQCLNCRALAKYLNRDKFEIAAMPVYSGDLDIEGLNPGKGLHLFHVRYPARIWSTLQFIRGLLWCDVAYLPSPGGWRRAQRILTRRRKKCLRTVEGVIDGIAKERAINCFGSEDLVRQFYASATKTVSITKAMVSKNKAAIGVENADEVLYLGTDYDEFAVKDKLVTALTDAVLIGADLKRKGIDDYLKLARKFATLRFHVVGGAVGGIDYAAQCNEAGLRNVVFHGPMSHAKLNDLLRTIQLHVFPSRAEGFPKVTLETAAAGVPSVVYDDYGADEWITTGKDGFVVKTIDEMAAVIEDLVAHPEKLQPLADNARKMAAKFDWKVRVKDWERVIEEVAGCC